MSDQSNTKMLTFVRVITLSRAQEQMGLSGTHICVGTHNCECPKYSQVLTFVSVITLVRALEQMGCARCSHFGGTHICKNSVAKVSGS